MADSLGTLVLKTTVDGDGVVTGLKKNEDAVGNFARSTKQQATELASAFDGAKEKASKIFGDLAAGNYKAALIETAQLAKDLFSAVSKPAQPRLDTAAAKKDLSDLAAAAQKAGTNFGRNGGVVQPSAAAAEGLGATPGVLGGIVGALGGVTAAAAIAAGTIAGIGIAARSVSKEINDTVRFAQRMGTDFAGAERLTRVLEGGGVEDANLTLSKFRERLGQVRSDINGPTAQAFRRLGLDPQQLVTTGTEQAFQQVILALHNTRDSFDQAELSQEIFTKRWVDLQSTVQRAPQLIARAAEQERRFGAGEGTIEAARHAESEWREVGHFFEDLWAEVGSGSRAVFSRVSDFAGTAANSVLKGAQWAVDGIGRTITGAPAPPVTGSPGQTPPPPPPPPSRSEVANRDFLRTLDARNAFERDYADIARQTGLVGQDATLQEIDAVRGLIQAREEQRRKMEDLGESAAKIKAELDKIDERNVEAAAKMLDRAIKAHIEGTRELAEQGRLAGDSGRRRAIDEGLVGVGATGGDAAMVADLLKRLDDFRKKRGVTPDEIAEEETRLRDEAFRRQQDAAAAGNHEAEQALALREQVELRGQALAIAKEEADVARGISTHEANRTRRIAEGNEALNVRAANRTPLEQFEQTNRLLAQNEKIDPADLNRDIARRFRQLASGLGSGPSSFGIQATDSRSMQGQLFADDFKIRGETQGRDVAEWTRQTAEAVQRQEQILEEGVPQIADAVRELNRRGVLLRKGGAF